MWHFSFETCLNKYNQPKEGEATRTVSRFEGNLRKVLAGGLSHMLVDRLICQWQHCIAIGRSSAPNSVGPRLSDFDNAAPGSVSRGTAALMLLPSVYMGRNAGEGFQVPLLPHLPTQALTRPVRGCLGTSVHPSSLVNGVSNG